jgi:hypothetical protein
MNEGDVTSDWNWTEWVEAFDMKALLQDNDDDEGEDVGGSDDQDRGGLSLQFHVPLTAGDVIDGNYSVMPSLRLDVSYFITSADG